MFNRLRLIGGSSYKTAIKLVWINSCKLGVTIYQKIQ